LVPPASAWVPKTRINVIPSERSSVSERFRYEGPGGPTSFDAYHDSVAPGAPSPILTVVNSFADGVAALKAGKTISMYAAYALN
jgi:hypothetical protein